MKPKRVILRIAVEVNLNVIEGLKDPCNDFLAISQTGGQQNIRLDEYKKQKKFLKKKFFCRDFSKNCFQRKPVLLPAILRASTFRFDNGHSADRSTLLDFFSLLEFVVVLSYSQRKQDMLHIAKNSYAPLLINAQIHKCLMSHSRVLNSDNKGTL